ncbi:TetR/AcrR family transcriptional regulator [Streptosporangium sp. KLBMP 9127]|nr:TetR/AcrR family transcriptional regulator [Streptosporangium sp. KLBMP 9127]
MARNTRERILDAAAEVMRARGLAHATTKEIARAADCSEAALYKHFRDKTEIFVGVLRERLPRFAPDPDLAGRNTVAENLLATARSALEFYRVTFPMAASIFAEPRLLAAHQESLRREATGPDLPNQEVAAYLRAERDLGRIAATADPEAAAALLVGACFQHAFLARFRDEDDPGTLDRTAAALTAALLASLLPPGEIG